MRNFQISDGAAYEKEFRELTVEYVASLGRDFSFQHLEEELESPAKKYIGSGGGMIVALGEDGTPVGCVAYWGHTPERCEMKRLYVKPEYRRLGVGKALGDEVLRRAKESGFSEMVLDTAVGLDAVRLYKRLGFEEIEAYYYNPMDDVLYMGKRL